MFVARWIIAQFSIIQHLLQFQSRKSTAHPIEHCTNPVGTEKQRKKHTYTYQPQSVTLIEDCTSENQ